jgi:hypothetical protein
MSILSIISIHIDRKIREATEIEHQPKNMIREDGLFLSKPWEPILCSLTECRNPPSTDSNGMGFSQLAFMRTL